MSTMSYARTLALCLISALACYAQESRGSISGRVTDSTGAAVPGAKIRLLNLSSNVNLFAESNAEGGYEIPYLLPGSYNLTAEMKGFKSYFRPGIEVRIADRLHVDVPLELGSLAEVITVRDETPLLETASSSVGQVVDNRRVSDLPMAHGNPYLLMTLSPGVAYTQNASLDRPFEPTHIVGYTMDGVRANRSMLTLDGAPNVAVYNRWGAGDLSAGYTPPSDIVQEFKVQTVNYDASIGHSQGGVTSMTLKSGGNSYHGTAYWSFARPSLNANLFFSNKNGQAPPNFDYNRYGATLTGPVRLPKYNGTNRTFITYGYEGIKEARPRGSILTVPTEAERNGDFSNYLTLGAQYQIYDPASRVRAANGRFALQPLAGNLVPASRIDPVARNILKYWPLPNTTGNKDNTNNLARPNEVENLNYYNHVGRVDHNFSSRHRIFGRVNTFNRYSNHDDWFHTVATGVYEDWLQKGGSVDDVYEISPTTILNFRYSFYRMSVHQFPKAGNLGFDLASLGFAKSYTSAIDPGVRAFPYIAIDGYATSINTNWALPMQNHVFETNLTKVRGGHTLRMGGDAMQDRQFQWDAGTVSSGAFNFSSQWTSGPFDNSPAPPRGGSLASFLLGLPAGGYVAQNASFAQQSTVYSLYFQDDWRVSSRLTLNLGLRYELEGPMTERFNRSVRGFDSSAPSPIANALQSAYAAKPVPGIAASDFQAIGGLTFPGVNNQPRALWNRDTNNLMPRIGFAFQLNPKTVLRGGWGVFYGPLGVTRGNVNQIGFSQNTDLIPSLDGGLTFNATLANPFPNGLTPPRGAADGLMTFVGRPISFFNPNPEAPRQQRWSFGIQHELPKRTVVEVSYVGNHGSSMEMTRDFRYLPSSYLSRSPVRDQSTIDWLSQLSDNPFYGMSAVAGTGLSGAYLSRSYLLSTHNNAQFTGMTSTDEPGYSWYHSLQVKTERRFAQGWTLNAAYTWSKFMQALSRLNGQDSPLEYVVSDSDRPHRFVVSGIWELPFGKGKRFFGGAHRAVDAVAGGWQVQGVYTGQSGAAFGWGNMLFYGSDIHSITLPKNQRTPDRWFNVDAGFERDSRKQLASNYRLWPSRLSDLRGDGMNNWDLSVIKNTAIRENLKVQFRAEALNALNHANFNAPNTSVTSSAFGTVTSTSGYARRMQMTLKVLF